MIVAIVGPHGAGKSTLGRALARRLGWTFDVEIGAELAASSRTSDHTAASPQVAFDAEVFRRELARDRARRGPAIVETWHPGNLAFASRRSPGVVARHLDPIRASVSGPCVVVPVLAPPDILAERAWEAGPPTFFLNVGMDAMFWAARLGVPVLDVVWTHRESPERLAEDVAMKIQEEAWNACS